MFPRDGLGLEDLSKIVLSFDPMYFVYAGLGAMLVGIISAVFPAQRAARLDPAVAIRG